mmetsp:Transcript_3042/g.12540  ORF Transcript_3042/g.12540 Transcript_3042/m.12540 type:complete len:201 (+) Transcript_3042:821-1423(+)
MPQGRATRSAGRASSAPPRPRRLGPSQERDRGAGPRRCRRPWPWPPGEAGPRSATRAIGGRWQPRWDAPGSIGLRLVLFPNVGSRHPRSPRQARRLRLVPHHPPSPPRRQSRRLHQQSTRWGHRTRAMPPSASPANQPYRPRPSPQLLLLLCARGTTLFETYRLTPLRLAPMSGSEAIALAAGEAGQCHREPTAPATLCL